jgi:predicted phage-related endonuclease
MLTPEQLKARQRTIGASEVAAVAGLSKWKTSADVWARKARGPKGDQPPLVEDDQTLDLTKPSTLGHLLEPTIVSLYVMHAQRPCVEGGTRAHPDHPWATATADRLVAVPDGHMGDGAPVFGRKSSIDRGLECKAVGPYMVSEWSDGPPDDVTIQCQWGMFVHDLPQWDVAALLGGTSFRVFTVERDDETIAALFALALAFWTDNVLADVMPDVSDGKAIQRVLSAKWAQDDGTTIDAGPDADAIADELKTVKAWIKGAKAHEAQLTGELCQLLGPAKKLKGEWGSFTWTTMAGGVAWKAVAESLAEQVDADTWEQLLEDHRSASYRKAGFYPKRAKKKTTTKGKSK